MNNSKFGSEGKDSDILFSRAIKAGKRIYYLDVKCDRKGSAYLALTESKRLQSVEGEMPQFEKHKIFLYQEDFDKFMDGLKDVLEFAENLKPKDEMENDDVSPNNVDFKINLDF